MKISIAITTYKRVSLTILSIDQVIDDERISEIIIVDDASNDGSYEKLKKYYSDKPKVFVYQNEKNLDCYLNKKRAIELCLSEYVIIFDSDNILTKKYIGAIFNNNIFLPQYILAPSFARPTFDYRGFNDLIIGKKNVAQYIDKPMFTTALNTSNYFVNRKEFLRCFDTSINPNTVEALWTNYNWLKAGNAIKFVSGMEYDHLIHDGSHYRNNVHKTGDLETTIINLLKQLK